MNNKLFAEVLNNGKDLRGSTLAVLLILIYYSNENQVCWPRVSKLAKHSHLKRRQVYYILEELINLGYVTVEEKGKFNRSPLYSIAVPKNHVETVENLAAGV